MNPIKINECLSNEVIPNTNIIKSNIWGAGLTLSSCHIDQILLTKPCVNWFEVSFFDLLKNPSVMRKKLQQLACHYPLVLKGAGLSLNFLGQVNKNHLAVIKNLIKDLGITWYSDPLFYSPENSKVVFDHLPRSLTQKMVQHLSERIHVVQEHLNQKILITNFGPYRKRSSSEMSEHEFLIALAKKSECNIVLDLENLIRNAQIHGFNSHRYIDAFEGKYIKQVRLNPESSDSQKAWYLLSYTLATKGDIPCTLKWNGPSPALDTCFDLWKKAQHIFDKRWLM